MSEVALEPAGRPQVPLGLSPLLVADLLENAHDAILVRDEAGSVSFWNAGAEALYGYARAEAIGRVSHELLETEFPEPIEQIMAQLRRAGVWSGQLRHRSKSGGSVVVESRWIRRATGGQAQYMEINRDITRRLAAEALATQRQEEAERANRAKTEFLSRMSHELRTPLTSVLGFGQLLEGGRGTTEEGREFAALIVRAGKHLLDLINEILDLARIEEGRVSLSMEPVLLGDVVADALGLIRAQADQRHIAIDDLVGHAATHVLADRQRLKQVLLNLLSNAVKYNTESGSIKISSGIDEAGLTVSIEDTGPGIDPAAQLRLFQPFERLGAEQTAVDGTGLGLALSRGLVEAMGGAIGCRSKVGQGSVFWVRFPVAASPVGTLDDGSPAEHAVATSLEGVTVLYVEDNHSNVMLMERLLGSRPGTKLIPAEQGRLGIDLAREHRPDVVFLDLNLPDLTGQEVLARLRADPATAGLFVVILSADAAGAQVRRMLDAGADAYLTKPFEVGEFLAILDAALARRGAGRKQEGESA